LNKHFGEVRAVDGLSFEVNAGEIFGLVGAGRCWQDHRDADTGGGDGRGFGHGDYCWR